MLYVLANHVPHRQTQVMEHDIVVGNSVPIKHQHPYRQSGDRAVLKKEVEYMLGMLLVFPLVSCFLFLPSCCACW